MNFPREALHHLRSLLLLRLLRRLKALEIDSPTSANGLAGKRHHWKIVTVAYFNHEPIWVMEEDLVHMDPTFFHPSLLILYRHLLQFLLHHAHALTLPNTNTNLESFLTLNLIRVAIFFYFYGVALPGRKCGCLWDWSRISWSWFLGSLIATDVCQFHSWRAWKTIHTIKGTNQ